VAQPTNRRPLDFEAQITKPKLPVLRPKPGNPPPPWFWSSTKKSTTGFEAKPGKTVASSVEAKLEKTVVAGFEAKPLETVAVGFEAKPLETIVAGFEVKPLETVTTGFEAKPAKIIWVILRPNHSQTVAIDFEAQIDEKLSQWFWGQTIDKPSTLVLRFNHDRRPHMTPLDHRVPDLWDYPRSSALGLLLLPQSSSLLAMS
jgi:hypothetical protein